MERLLGIKSLNEEEINLVVINGRDSARGDIYFDYDPMGNRIAKHVSHNNGDGTSTWIYDPAPASLPEGDLWGCFSQVCDLGLMNQRQSINHYFQIGISRIISTSSNPFCWL